MHTTSHSEKIQIGILIVLIAFLFGITLSVSWPFTADDAYITLRYSQHFAEGHGIVWNIGEPPLEGYSNFTYMLFGALLFYPCAYFHIPIIFVFHAFSLLCFITSMGVIYRIMHLWVSPLIALLPLILLLIIPGALWWTVSGLETAFFQLLILLTVYALLREKTLSAGFWMAAAGLTRPEAALFFLVFGLILLTQQKTLFSRALWHYIGAFTAIYLPYFIFRLYYFGHLFPNPIACKCLDAAHPTTLFFDYLRLALPLWAASLFILWVKSPEPSQAIQNTSCITLHSAFFYFCIPPLICLLMLYGVDPIVGYFNRYGQPFLPLLMMSSVLGLHQLNYLIKDNIKEGKFTLLFFIVFFALFLIREADFIPKEAQAAAFYVKRNAMRVDLAKWMEEKHSTSIGNTNTQHTPSIVIGDCGIVPFFLPHHEIIDSLCLNSREMTSPAIHRSYPLFIDWVLHQKKPDYIVVTRLRWSGNTEYYWPVFEKLLLNDPDFRANYHFVKRFSSSLNIYSEPLHYQYWVYQRT